MVYFGLLFVDDENLDFAAINTGIIKAYEKLTPHCIMILLLGEDSTIGLQRFYSFIMILA